MKNENLKALFITMGVALVLTIIGLAQYNFIGQWSGMMTLVFAIASWFIAFIIGMAHLFESIVRFNLKKGS